MPLQTPGGLTRPPFPTGTCHIMYHEGVYGTSDGIQGKRMAYHSSYIARQPHGMDELSIGVIFAFGV